MVEIKNGNASSSNAIAASDLNTRTTDLRDRFRDQAEHDKHDHDLDDEIAQTLVSVQLLMLPAPKLEIRSRMRGVAEKTRNGLSERKASAAGVEGGHDTGASTLKLHMALDQVRDEAFRAALTGNKNSAIAFGGPAAMTQPAMALPLQNLALSRQTDESRTHSVATRKDKKDLADDAQQNKLEPSEKLLRDRLAAHAMPTKLRGMDLRAQVVAQKMAAPQNEGEQGWIYNFRTWGKQHAVRIAPPTGTNVPSPLAYASIHLQPFSALVEQRLHEHAGMARQGEQWLLKEHKEQQHQQDARKQKDELDEDEA